MTFTEEYLPDEDRELEELANYPTAFGITFTPKVTGIALAGAGLLGSLYLALNWVLPAYQYLQQLQTDRTGKEQQVEQQKSGVAVTEFQKVEARLQQKEATKQRILSLFANEKDGNTILLDIDGIFRSRNVTLLNFQPQGTGATIIADGSLGADVNNKLKRQTFNVQMQGKYTDSQNVIRDLERLQPLLLLRNLSTQAEGEGATVQVVSTGKNRATIVPGPDQPVTTSFLLDLIAPLSPEELAKLAPPPPPAGGQPNQGGQPPANTPPQ
jgi:hypothetical protein